MAEACDGAGIAVAFASLARTEVDRFDALLVRFGCSGHGPRAGVEWG